uniref:Ryncolin n=1 Tax=Hemiscolopendra marginata TaxID=943146 RepID=A0A646QF39_9MYRI
MELTDRFFLSFLILFYSAPLVISETEKIEVFTSPLERIPIPHALKSLEEAVKEVKAVEEFCNKHYGNVKGDRTKTNNANEIPGLIIKKPSDCADIYSAGFKTSGIYTIFLKPAWMSVVNQMTVYCDMETDGGGWTVFQRRGNFEPRINFNRNWEEYSKGFGDFEKEFWLVNENIHKLTTQDNVTLRVDIEDWDRNFRHAVYDAFEISGYKNSYVLTIGKYNGTAGDAMTYHNGSRFATNDHDNEYNCSKTHSSGWWFKHCGHSSLNGVNMRDQNDKTAKGIIWHQWLGTGYSLKWTEMKIRPRSFKQ